MRRLAEAFVPSGDVGVLDHTGQGNESGHGHGEAVTMGPDWRDLAAGAAAFGGLFAAEWAISQRWSRKSTPE